LVVGYRRFGTNYQLVLTAWALKMRSVGFPETSVTTNQCCVTSHKSEDLKIELDVPKQMKVNVDDKKAFNTFEKYL
jgi:hypothetical protein